MPNVNPHGFPVLDLGFSAVGLPAPIALPQSQDGITIFMWQDILIGDIDEHSVLPIIEVATLSIRGISC